MRDDQKKLLDIIESVENFGIDLNMVWNTVITDIPVLKQDVNNILQNEEKNCI